MKSIISGLLTRDVTHRQVSRGAAAAAWKHSTARSFVFWTIKSLKQTNEYFFFFSFCLKREGGGISI
jgi:hypothetical protein